MPSLNKPIISDTTADNNNTRSVASSKHDIIMFHILNGSSGRGWFVPYVFIRHDIDDDDDVSIPVLRDV